MAGCSRATTVAAANSLRLIDMCLVSPGTALASAQRLALKRPIGPLSVGDSGMTLGKVA